MSKLALYKLPALFVALLLAAAYFWGEMGIVVVLATATAGAAIGFLFKEL